MAGNLFGSTLFAQLADDVGLVLCDIGSRGGVLEDFVPAAAYTGVIGFEPDRAECDRLNEAATQSPRQWKMERHFPVALGEFDTKLQLKVCKAPSYSSTLEPDERLPTEFGRQEQFRVIERLDMDVSALDGFCSKNGIADMDFLKVDVQGSELSILRGGSTMIGEHLLGIRSEVEFAQLYAGQPLCSEMEIHLRRSGFYTADWLFQRHWRNDPRFEHGEYCHRHDLPYSRGRLIHSDALFLRDHHWIIANMPDADAKLCRLILIALLYHHVDLAATVLPFIKSNQVVKSVSQERWRQELSLVSRSLSRITLRRLTKEWTRKFCRLIRR